MPRRLRIGFPRYVLVADSAALAVTGQSANLRRGKALVSAQGALGVVGQAAALRKAFRVVAAQGSYAITGQAATLTKSSSGVSDNPGPSGAAAFTFSWSSATYDAAGGTYPGSLGIKIYYGTTEGALTFWKYVSDASTLTATVSGLSSGVTYYVCGAFYDPSDPVNSEGEVSQPVVKVTV